MNEHLTITLTGRAPVRIRKADWPIVAKAAHWDGEIEAQANRHAQLIVRQHADGRAVVYGIYTTLWQGERDRRGGQLLQAGADLVSAIYAVAQAMEFDEDLAQRTIADLPAVEI